MTWIHGLLKGRQFKYSRVDEAIFPCKDITGKEMHWPEPSTKMSPCFFILVKDISVKLVLPGMMAWKRNIEKKLNTKRKFSATNAQNPDMTFLFSNFFVSENFILCHLTMASHDKQSVNNKCRVNGYRFALHVTNIIWIYVPDKWKNN